MRIDIKECPFCNQEMIEIDVVLETLYKGYNASLTCVDCGVSMKGESLKDDFIDIKDSHINFHRALCGVIEKWNRRVYKSL